MQSQIPEKGMVTSFHSLASEAGVEILRRGGNAVDAAVAACLALNVVLPHMCGIGGEGRALIYMRRTGEKLVVNWSARCPMAASPAMFDFEPERGRLVVGPSVPLTGYMAVKDDANEHGYKAVMVPGAIAGYAMALARCAALSLEEVMQPAIRLAEEGFPVTPQLARYIGENADLLSRYPASADLFLKNGIRREWDVGGARLTLVQSDLAKTLKKIAADGPDVFYRGEIARQIVEAMKAYGGLITLEDLARYQAEILDPCRGSFRGYDVFGVPGGGTTVVQIMNILDGYDLTGYDLNSPQIMHLFAEAVRLTFGDRVNYISGDLEAVPWDWLCSAERARSLRNQIDPARAAAVDANRTFHEGQDTTHLCVVDAERNVVSATITLGGAFGARVVIPGTGVTMNNLIHSLNPEAGDINSVGPWKRRRIPHASSLVMRGDIPILAIGGMGGEKQIVATARVMLNTLHHGLPIQAAIDSPRLFRGLREEIYVSTDMPEATVSGLAAMGHLVVPQDPEKFLFGRVTGIMIDSGGRPALQGGIEKYSDGKAVGF